MKGSPVKDADNGPGGKVSRQQTHMYPVVHATCIEVLIILSDRRIPLHRHSQHMSVNTCHRSAVQVRVQNSRQTARALLANVGDKLTRMSPDYGCRESLIT